MSFLLDRYFRHSLDEDAARATTIGFLGFLLRLALWVVIVLVGLDNLGVNVTALVAGLGIGGVAVAPATQSILGDVFASLSIVLDQPFVVGAFIMVDQLGGRVEHIGLKTTRVRSVSGEEIIFANGELLRNRIRNYRESIIRQVVEEHGRARFEREGIELAVPAHALEVRETTVVRKAA